MFKFSVYKRVKMLVRALLCISVLIIPLEAFKVLVVFPFAIRSLNILGEGYVRHLLKAGHEVTYITCFPMKNGAKNLRQIDVSSNAAAIEGDDDTSAFTIKSIMDNTVPMNDVAMLQQYAYMNANSTFRNENVKKLLEDTSENFDVVLVDLYETEVFAGLSALYNCPMIWSYSMGAHWLVLRLADEPTNPAYTADYLSSNVLPFSFQQRVEELWAQIKWSWIKRTKTMPVEKEMYEEVFTPLLQKRGRNLPEYEELIYNASLIFANEHHAFGNIPRLPQNFKLVGGYHIEKSANPLPEDLQKLMDNAQHGVIYFSMGSTWKSKDLPTSVKEGLVKMFGELKQTVIWKYEENLPNVSKNLKIVHWAPQQSILDHPNCLFFITHGGHLSSTEAIHFGVPIIGMPVFFDQFININKAAAKGYAIRVPLTYDIPRTLKEAILTMLSDPKYRQKAKELSAIYHDRPVKPGQEVVHWLEHVIKTSGAPHLRSPALHMPFYQKLYLDLVALIAGVCVVMSVTVKIIVKSFRVKGKRGKKEKKN